MILTMKIDFIVRIVVIIHDCHKIKMNSVLLSELILHKAKLLFTLPFHDT